MKRSRFSGELVVVEICNFQGICSFQGAGFFAHWFCTARSRDKAPRPVLKRRRSFPADDAYQKTEACNKFSTRHLALDRRGGIHIFSVMAMKPVDEAASRSGIPEPSDGPRRELSPAARRALAEAAARRAEFDRKSSERPEEVNGRGGPDPARYGDWEVRGIASDF